MGNKYKIKKYNGFYDILKQDFDMEIMEKMYNLYKGQSVTFPTNLYNPEWKKEQIWQDYSDGATVRELARKYNYCEQRIRVILKKCKEENN